jgi:chromosome segregation ATPase
VSEETRGESLSARLREALSDELMAAASHEIMLTTVRWKWPEAIREVILAALAPVVEDAEREKQQAIQDITNEMYRQVAALTAERDRLERDRNHWRAEADAWQGKLATTVAERDTLQAAADERFKEAERQWFAGAVEAGRHVQRAEAERDTLRRERDEARAERDRLREARDRAGLQ